MSKRALVFILLILALAILLGAVAFGMTDKQSGSNTLSTPIGSVPSDDKTEQTGQPITASGEFICLQPTGDGPHTMECAFGLKTDDGTTYGLRADDPMLIGTIPTGLRVEVTGSLQVAQDEKYQTAGTIKATSAKQLQ